MKFIRFNDSVIDTGLFLQLQDLSTVLSGDPEMEFEFNYGSFVDLKLKKVTASRIWDNSPADVQRKGLKSDVLLRTVGTLFHTNVPALKQFIEWQGEVKIPGFAAQLFTLLEDFRLEQIVRKQRPGTRGIFDSRIVFYRKYFETQLAANVTRSYALDELFCLIYLTVYSDRPDPVFAKANDYQLTALEGIKPFLYSIYEAGDTQDIKRMTESAVLRLEESYDDMINEYFILPVNHIDLYKRDTLFDEMTRNDDPAAEREEKLDQEKNEYMDEQFSTWHRETKNGENNQTFLQFELEQGTRTNLMGGGAREAEDADQALASVQGASGESRQKDYEGKDALQKSEDQTGRQSGGNYGEMNRFAVKLSKMAESPSASDEQVYRSMVKEIEPYKRKLAGTIEKILEHKKNSPRRDLSFGRLSKKLLPLVLEDQPRVFYKKNNESKEIDACFTLLVDCSASMHNKMHETKRGIALFHEVLKQLKIPHSIVGFWEDANGVKEGYQPNYFHRIHSFEDSFYQSGAKILQLEPEEDNRDGFSIRVMTEELEKRKETNKFLLVFSDGEPAAAQYDQNGIVDTHTAVLAARKKRIDTVGIFLADGMIAESEEKMMENIYGKEQILIPSVAFIPEYFTPLLKKLLLKSI
ncbi:vWA domain-containing protein [Bacillus massiliglaciei]|uniref:vWA domain-containing protein n=1 Tax=Bacillus massiliglaciei TaxID=1816693 RepID=UPI000AE2C393|nr:VWA domain-containing protein [Bacillus massiliglaciei]